MRYELLATNKQIWFIEKLLKELDLDFKEQYSNLFYTTGITNITKKQASLDIQYLLKKKEERND